MTWMDMLHRCSETWLRCSKCRQWALRTESCWRRLSARSIAGAQSLTERLLQQVSANHLRLLVLDLTGVAEMDTAVAQALLQLVQAVRLHGCEVVITGISATVASTITVLGIDLDGVRTMRSPQDVLLRHVAGLAA